MLWILQDRILPDLLRNGAERLVMAHLPVNAPVGIDVRELPAPPLQESNAIKKYPIGKEWRAAQMHSLHYPSIYCIVEGEADLAMGVTTSMLNTAAHKSTFGELSGYVFSLQALSYFIVPPNIPQRTSPPWQRDEPHRDNSQVFVMRILPVGALCTLTEMIGEDFRVGYSLLIKDTYLAMCTSLLIDELQIPDFNREVVSSQMKTLMLRLHRALNHQSPLMTDGLYSRFPNNDAAGSPLPLLHHPVIERAQHYIQLHLHETLTPAQIAAEVQVTPEHLGRILKARTGFTTMRYVTQLRLESAKLLLSSSDLSIQEISKLVGYRQLPYFSRSFYTSIGETPSHYRQRTKEQ